jgi:hypothetical protein
MYKSAHHSTKYKPAAPGEVWISDRNFCACDFLFGFVDKHSFFLIRQHGRSPA